MTKWTREELDALEKHFPSAPIETLRCMFPTHSERSIFTKASYLGLRRSEAYIRNARTLRATRHNKVNRRKVVILSYEFNRVVELLEEGQMDAALRVANGAVEQLNKL